MNNRQLLSLVIRGPQEVFDALKRLEKSDPVAYGKLVTYEHVKVTTGSVKRAYAIFHYLPGIPPFSLIDEWVRELFAKP